MPACVEQVAAFVGIRIEIEELALIVLRKAQLPAVWRNYRANVAFLDFV